MENPEKSQNKGEGTNTAEGCGRHRAALGCRVLVDECGG